MSSGSCSTQPGSGIVLGEGFLRRAEDGAVAAEDDRPGTRGPLVERHHALWVCVIRLPSPRIRGPSRCDAAARTIGQRAHVEQARRGRDWRRRQMEWNEPLYQGGIGRQRPGRGAGDPRLRRLASLAAGAGRAAGRRGLHGGPASADRPRSHPRGDGEVALDAIGPRMSRRPSRGCRSGPTRSSCSGSRWEARWPCGWPSGIRRWRGWSPVNALMRHPQELADAHLRPDRLPPLDQGRRQRHQAGRVWTRRPTTGSPCAPPGSSLCSWPPTRRDLRLGPLPGPALLVGHRPRGPPENQREIYATIASADK